MNPLLLVLLGLALLTFGAESLIRAASALATRLGVSRALIGLTVVAFGTSFPELSVSALAAARGQADLTLGNIVGSNLFNILFILGASALLHPLSVSLEMLKRDIPLMIFISALTWGFASDGWIGKAEAALLLLGMGLYLRRLVSFEESDTSRSEPSGNSESTGWLSLQALFSLLVLVLGTDVFLKGAVQIARNLGISELGIGLTVLAAGTSLPEAATSFAAARRGEVDLAVGNLIGSNLFNLMTVLSTSTLISIQPEGLRASPELVAFDLPAMFFASLACLPICSSHGQVDRREGCLLVASYGVYLWVLFQTQLDAQPVPSPLWHLGALVLTLALATLSGAVRSLPK